MDFTTRLKLSKPDGDPVTGDFVDIDVLNVNFDTIDSYIGTFVCTSVTRPAQPFTGQLIFETDTGLVFVWTGSAWSEVTNISVNPGATVCTSATRPASPWDGQFIYETDTQKVFVRDNTAASWVEVTNFNVNPGATVCTSATRPASPWDGQFIYETDTLDTYVWSGTQWVQVNGSSGGTPSGDLFARKMTDQQVVSSTVLVDDSDLFLAVEANSVYLLESNFRYSAGTGADFKIGWSAPSGSVFDWAIWAQDSTADDVIGTITNQELSITDTAVAGGIGGIGDLSARPVGILITGGSGGTFRFRFAQNTSGATPTVVRANSWIKLQKVS